MSPASAGVPTVVIHPPEEDLEALQGQEHLWVMSYCNTIFTVSAEAMAWIRLLSVLTEGGGRGMTQGVLGA